MEDIVRKSERAIITCVQWEVKHMSNNHLITLDYFIQIGCGNDNY